MNTFLAIGLASDETLAGCMIDKTDAAALAFVVGTYTSVQIGYNHMEKSALHELDAAVAYYMASFVVATALETEDTAPRVFAEQLAFLAVLLLVSFPPVPQYLAF